MSERGAGGKILSLATKRARRVQEKVLQKMGKSDQTKDDVFQDFVNNFNKQYAAATKLQKEITKFMSATRTLHQCSISLGRTLEDLYEPTWAGCDDYKNIVDTRNLLWEDQIVSFHSKIVEPMNNYISKFPEVKNRIQKRERKVVDYDLRRRELESLKTKQKVTDQKLQQAEDAYTQAKHLYDEITDELYEELPNFFDSRIQFYASVFQSLAATQVRFHSEMTKVDEQFANLMDGLASEAATAIHTTKKERTLDSTVKLTSRPGEDDDSDEDVPSSPPSFTSDPRTAPQHTSPTSSSPTSASSPVHSETTETKPDRPAAVPGDGTGSLRRQPPSKPTRSTSSMEGSDDPSPVSSQQQLHRSVSPTQDGGPESPRQSLSEGPPQPYDNTHELSAADLAELDDVISSTETKPAVAASPPPVASPVAKSPPPVEQKETPEVGTGQETEASGGAPTEPANTLYKVIATHPYAGEDEDELSFEKGEMIAVVPFDDPEDEEEGWLTGVMLSSGAKGIFPANFTKKHT